MNEKGAFIPSKYFNGENLNQIDISNCPDLVHLLNALKNNCLGVINGIYGQTNKVAEILQTPKSSISKDIEIIKQWIGTIIPILEIDNKEKSITTLSDFAIASLGIRILNMIIEGKNEQEIAKAYEAFELFKDWDLKNNLSGILKWKFTPQENVRVMDNFAKIMKVRV